MSENQSGVSSVRKEIAIVAGPRGWGDSVVDRAGIAGLK